jgi:Holliday junction DNA helicase RuvA
MIAHLRGKLIAKNAAGQAIVEAAGVGYELAISVPTFADLPAVGNEVALHVHTHVREDQFALYGFLRQQEKQLFEKLLSVSGIGPKVALNILSGIKAEMLVAAIRGNDLAQLTRVPGVGKKTAERMVVELRDKLESFAAAPATPPASPLEEDVISALVNLGYPRAAAERALSKLAPAQNGGGEFEAVFRAALAAMGR